MTKISQITGVSLALANTDLLEKEKADGTSQRFAASQIVTLVITEIPYFIIRSTGANGHRWKITIDDTGELTKEDLGV